MINTRLATLSGDGPFGTFGFVRKERREGTGVRKPGHGSRYRQIAEGVVAYRKCRAESVADAAMGMGFTRAIAIFRVGNRGGPMITICVVAGVILFGWRGFMLAVRRNGSRRPRQWQGNQQNYCE